MLTLGLAWRNIQLLKQNNHPGTNMNTFTASQQLSTSSICDSEYIFTTTVIKRTAKTVTIKVRGYDKRCKIHKDDEGNEFIYPYGRYSMCAIFRA